jgi:crossover junction endodeoxyribonuclease RuvC
MQVQGSMALKLIGIDPGLAATGIGIVSGNHRKVEDFAYGVIHTDRKDPTSRRLEIIFTQISNLLQRESPDLIVVEDISGKSLWRHFVGRRTGVGAGA